MRKSRIISALIGLVGACGNNPKTENTDRVVIEALAYPLPQTETSEESIQSLVEEIHTEKYAVAPGCAVCQTPCSNTSDYDMSRIYEAEEEIRDLKLGILSEVEKLAADLYRCGKIDALSGESAEVFYKALAYISFDMERDGLLAFRDETREAIEKIKGEIR